MAEAVDVQGSEDDEDNKNFKMFEACGKGDLLTVSRLVEQVSDINWCNLNYDFNFTFLHKSARGGHLQVLKLLLDHGADLKVKAKDDASVLHVACLSGNVQMIGLLVDKDPSLLLEKDNNGATVLHFACVVGSLDIVLYFLSKGLSLRDKDKGDRTCLHYACMTEKWTVIEYLLKNGLSLYDSDKGNTTPLDILNSDRYPGPPSAAKKIKYCLQQLKARGTEFLNAEDLARIPDAVDLSETETSTATSEPISETPSAVVPAGEDGVAVSTTDYRLLLKKAAAKGTIRTRRTNLGLGGASGVGKTSTLRLLTDQKPDPQHDSTAVLKPVEYFSEDISESISKKDCCTDSSDDTDSGKSDDEDKPPAPKKPRISISPTKQFLLSASKKKKWSPATQQALLHKLASCVVTLATNNPSLHKPHEGRCGLSMERKFFFPFPYFFDDSEDSRANPAPTAEELQKLSFDNLTAAQKIIDFIKANIEDLQKELGITHFVNACDTGGQAAFIDIAPALIRFNSINLVLFKLDEKLDSLAQFFYSIKGKVVGTEKRQITTKSLIYSMISSKSKIQKSNIGGLEVIQTQSKSMFAILGTHLDKYQTLPDDSQESLEKKEKELKDLLHKYEDCIIPNGENIIFPLNTLSRDKKTRRMAAIIREIAMQYYIEAEVPVSWYIFLVAINEIKVSKNHMIHISKFIEVGKYIKISEKEVRASLHYFHEITVCSYFPYVLPDVVFASPQFLFDKISELIGIPLGECPAGVGFGDLKQFKNYGIFTKNFLKFVCKGFEDGLFTADDFLKLMAYLFIISQLPDTPDQYFMPCVLQIAEKPFEDLPKSKIDVEPLLFTWNNTVPNGLFPSLVTSLISSKGTCFTMSSEVIQYRNKITFNCPRYASVVTLIEGNSFIAIAVTCLVKKSCVHVREAILNGIDRVVERFDWQPSVAYPEEVFACKATDNCVASSDHNVPFTHFGYPEVIENQLLVCSRNSSRTVELTDAHLIWHNSETDKSSEIVTPCIIFRFLQDKSADWNRIGRELGLSENYRIGLRNNLTTDDARLEAILNEWLESSPTPVTWSGFIDILNDLLHYRAIARQVHTFITQL